MVPDASSYEPSTASMVDPAKSGRYAYLVGRLHNRQITMEEATELFGILQAMLKESLAVRARLERASLAPAKPAAAPSAAPTGPVRVAMSDDLLLLGLLAVGAGAGLGAAIARKAGSGDPRQDPSGSRGTRSARAP